MEILTKENLVGAITAPTEICRTSTPLLRETKFLSKDSLLPPRIGGKSADVGVGGRIGILNSSFKSDAQSFHKVISQNKLDGNFDPQKHISPPQRLCQAPCAPPTTSSSEPLPPTSPSFQ